MEVARINLTLGNAQREFLYRKGTVDEGVVVQVLQTSALDLGRLRRGAELAQFYERLAAGGKAPLIIDSSANIGASAVFFSYKFPKARVVALEPDPGKFRLLTTNTAGLPAECVQMAVAAETGADDAAAITVNDLYRRYTQDAAPFIVKIDVEAVGGLLFTANTEWVGHTPVIIAALSDHLIPGTAASRAFVEYIAYQKRDIFYVQDNVFAVSQVPDAAQVAA